MWEEHQAAAVVCAEGRAESEGGWVDLCFLRHDKA